MGKDPGLSALRGPTAPETTKVLDVKLPSANAVTSLDSTSFSSKLARPTPSVTPLAGQIEKNITVGTSTASPLNAPFSKVKGASAQITKSPLHRFKSMAARIGRWFADLIRAMVMRLLRLTGDREITVVAPQTEKGEKKAEAVKTLRPEETLVHRQ